MNRHVSTTLSAALALTAGLAAEKPIHQYTYLATHNAIASYAYGYNLQNSQRYDVTTQLNAGVRMMEIDFVYDKPDDKHPAAVYICHCGKAPHSNSAIELKRARDQDLTSKKPLPNWSNGGKYIRFSTILQQIDIWLTLNPKEIVFILPQNNSATVSQFDTEVAAAAMRTGFYVRPDNATTWPIKSELVQSNKRIIILANDGVDLSTSKYANKKSATAWEGYIRPKMYGDVNEYSPKSSQNDQFLVLGSFSTSPTDAITARYYNDYDELKKRKSEWTAQGFTRYPTFIQVNQVHIGDALKFVNELNGSDLQITGTVPKDPAGEWLVNASADIGAAFYKIGEHFEGDKVPPGSRGIYFRNEAGYVAKMTISYFTSTGNQTLKTESTDKLTAGMTRSIVLPSDLSTDKPIKVFIEGFGTTKNSVYTTTLDASFTESPCFKAWGTIFGPRGGKCD